MSAGGRPSLTLDGDEDPWIASEDADEDGIQLSSDTSGTWATSPLLASGRGPILRLTSSASEIAHIVFLDDGGVYHVREAPQTAR